MLISNQLCVYGLWHLGSVISASMASLGVNVVGLDPDSKVIDQLSEGNAPIEEENLNALLLAGIKNSKLSFTNDINCIRSIGILWVTFDTPIDEDDNADVDYVINKVLMVINYLKKDAIILISSQIPVGTVSLIEDYCNKFGRNDISIAYSPENLRLGNAIDIFLNPDRIIIGIRRKSIVDRLTNLFSLFNCNIIWMSVESAEMTKHAINSFLAISVTFANEMASICELVGADAKQVEKGLKSEKRIGPFAYLSPGSAFSGGTLARDIAFMNNLAIKSNLKVPLLSSIKLSNDLHKNWIKRKLNSYFDCLNEKIITVWGLTYKPGTSTIRRSSSVELCNWLIDQGVKLRVHDPSLIELPKNWVKVTRFTEKEKSLIGSQSLIISTQWPEYKEVDVNEFNCLQNGFLVIDPNSFVKKLAPLDNLSYFSVGSIYHE